MKLLKFSLVFLFMRFKPNYKFLSIYKSLYKTGIEVTKLSKHLGHACAHVHTHTHTHTHTEWDSTAQLMCRRSCRSSQAIRRTGITAKQTYVHWYSLSYTLLVFDDRFKSNCGPYLVVEYCASICTSLNRLIFLRFCYWKRNPNIVLPTEDGVLLCSKRE
jgi:hypothetical protein